MHDRREQCLQNTGTPVTSVTPMLEVKSTPLQYTRDMKTYYKKSSMQKAQHTNVCEGAVLFWKTDASWEEVLG